MKKKFLNQRFLHLSLLFASAICFQPDSCLLNADNNTDSKSDSRLSSLPTTRHRGNPALSGLKDDESSLKWLNDSSMRRSYASNNGSFSKTDYHSPGQIIFPIESSSSAPQKTINSSMSFVKTPIFNTNDFLSQVDEPDVPAGMQKINGSSSVEEDANQEENKTILINFPNISIIEYIRFISRLTNKNFVFDENDLQFYVTIISEEPATLQNIMTALLQELRIHDLSMMEQGNNIIIHRNPRVNAISELITDDISRIPEHSLIVTQVFRLNTLRPNDIANVIRPLTSEYALVEILEGTNHLIITDLASNITQIAKLIKSLDSPVSGLVIGQYVVRTASPDFLIEMARNIIAPISGEQSLTMVPWEPSGSIFVISTPFLVERTLSILQHLDQNEKSTKIFDLQDMRYTETGSDRGNAPSGLFINNEPYKSPAGGGIPQFPGAPSGINRLPGRGPGTSTGTGFGFGKEGIVNPGKWYRDANASWSYPLGKDLGGSRLSPPNGRWKLDKDGNWQFEPSSTPPKPGVWKQDRNGRWYFEPSEFPAGEGSWKQDENGNWYYEAGAGPLEGGRWVQGKDGRWHFEPGSIPSSQGVWKRNQNGDWYLEGFSGISIPEDLKEEALPHPNGHWIFDPVNGWTYELDQGEAVGIKKVMREAPQETAIPFGAEQKSQFYIYKLLYRRGETIQTTLQAIAESVNTAGPGNEPFLNTLLSVQWLETSNSLIFTGFEEDLLKMRTLMKEVDTPLRQVFIEMLILETSMDDSLEYGVTWGSRFGGGNWAGGQGFSTDLSPVANALNQTGNPNGIGGGAAANGLFNATAPTALSTANSLGTGLGLSSVLPATSGLNMGVIGQSIINTSLGVQFNSIGALLHALRTKVNTDVILSPKIITEDNVPAEIFVGENIAFKTQSLASGDLNNTITNNFEYRDVGTRLRVTPSIGNNNIIALEIAQEISRIIPSTIPTTNANNAPGPSTSKSTTTTRVHLPDGYFLIISGMMKDESDRFTTQIPCLGAIPILGGAFKDKIYNDTKRNQMIFLRPKIIDTEEEIQSLTKHEQDIWDYKHRRKKDWIYEVEEAFDYLNLQRDIIPSDPEIADRDT